MARMKVTFKDEGEDGGRVIGPVKVFDLDLYEKDPEVMKPGLGVPFGYKPQGVADLGWRTLAYAREVARRYGVELEEV